MCCAIGATLWLPSWVDFDDRPCAFPLLFHRKPAGAYLSAGLPARFA
jgi:hypothetical protein